MGILFVPMFLAGIVMMRKNPELLQKRLNAKEKQEEQSVNTIYLVKIKANHNAEKAQMVLKASIQITEKK